MVLKMILQRDLGSDEDLTMMISVSATERAVNEEIDRKTTLVTIIQEGIHRGVEEVLVSAESPILVQKVGIVRLHENGRSIDRGAARNDPREIFRSTGQLDDETVQEGGDPDRIQTQRI
jgi:hypothetical protein